MAEEHDLWMRGLGVNADSSDKRTDQEVTKELETRTKRSVSELMLGLGRGPVQMSPRELEAELYANGTLKRRLPDNKPPGKQVVMDEVLEPDQYNADRVRGIARIGPEDEIERKKQAGQRAALDKIQQGLMAAGGARKGSASEGLVRPVGPEDGVPRTYEPSTGANKPAAPPFGGLPMPPKPGEEMQMKGFQNEAEVARVTGGKLARDPSKISKSGQVEDTTVTFNLPNGQKGSVKVDVVGPNGELILVGGPAKQDNISKTIQRLTDVKRAAEATGVKGQAYFTSDTPPDVLDKARKVLGNDNVLVFDRPAYKTP